MTGIVEGIAGNSLWSGIIAATRRVLGQQIQITYPRPQETLSGAEPPGSGYCFPVHGTLKHLHRLRPAVLPQRCLRVA